MEIWSDGVLARDGPLDPQSQPSSKAVSSLEQGQLTGMDSSVCSSLTSHQKQQQLTDVCSGKPKQA